MKRRYENKTKKKKDEGRRKKRRNEKRYDETLREREGRGEWRTKERTTKKQPDLSTSYFVSYYANV